MNTGNSFFGFLEQLFEKIVEFFAPLLMKILPLDKILNNFVSSPENITNLLSPDVISKAVSSGAISQDMISNAIDSGMISSEVIADAIQNGMLSSEVISGAGGEITAEAVADAIANGQIDPAVISDALASGDISSEVIADVVSDAVSSGALSPDLISDVLSDVVSSGGGEVSDVISSGLLENLSGLLPMGTGIVALIFGLVFSLVYLTALVFLFIALWKTYAKAGQPGWAVLIPFYGSFIHYRVAWGSGGFYFLSWIPFASFIIGLITDAKLSKAFGHKFGFTLGLWFLPFIFTLILGFDKKPYVGKAKPLR